MDNKQMALALKIATLINESNVDQGEDIKVVLEFVDRIILNEG